DRQGEVRRKAAAQHLAGGDAERIRLLRERESERRPSTLEPGDGAADRRILPAQDADVQRLRRSGREPLQRHGPAKEFLTLSDRVVRFVLKPLVFIASLGPLAWLAWAALTGNLSANPLSDLTNETGVWTLRFICITLALTPLRRVTGWNPAIKF